MSVEVALDQLDGRTCDDCPVPELRHSAELDGEVARTLAAYALNLAHGADLQPFELEHLMALAKQVGCVVTDQHRAFGATRVVLGQVMSERRRQVELHGYTAEHDQANPMRMHDEVLTRVSGLPSPETRQDLVQAAAIIVAEIERIDRAQPEAEGRTE